MNAQDAARVAVVNVDDDVARRIVVAAIEVARRVAKVDADLSAFGPLR